MTGNRLRMLILAAAALAGAVFLFWPSRPADGPAGAPLVAVRVPASLDAEAEAGRMAFEANCAACHGVNAAGRDGLGPPLIHKIYEPGHHGDASFLNAAANGVRAHHWPFGNMPPVAGLSRSDIDAIIVYVRTVQRENGIF